MPHSPRLPSHRSVEPMRAADCARAGRLTLVDVRSDIEHAHATVPGALHVPYPALEQRLAELPSQQPIAFLDRTGRRSAHATVIAQRNGREAYAVRGGLEAWAGAGLPSDPPNGSVRWRDPRIGPALAWSLRGSLLVVDLRPPHAYRQEHIPSARNVPDAELDDCLATLARAPVDVAFVCADDRAPARAVARMRAIGSPSWRIDGGMTAWRAAGLPLQRD